MNGRLLMRENVYRKKHMKSLYLLRLKIIHFAGFGGIRNCSIIVHLSKRQIDDGNLRVGGVGLLNVNKLSITCGIFLALLSYKFLEL